MKKNTRLGTQSQQHSATVRRGRGGIVEMIEFTEYEPNPLAPIIHVTKIGGIYRLGSLLKVTFVSDIPSAAGLIRTIERASLLWEIGDVVAANSEFDWAFKEWQKGNVNIHSRDGDGGRRDRRQ